MIRIQHVILKTIHRQIIALRTQVTIKWNTSSLDTIFNLEVTKCKTLKCLLLPRGLIPSRLPQQVMGHRHTQETFSEGQSLLPHFIFLPAGYSFFYSFSVLFFDPDASLPLPSCSPSISFLMLSFISFLMVPFYFFPDVFPSISSPIVSYSFYAT